MARKSEAPVIRFERVEPDVLRVTVEKPNGDTFSFLLRAVPERTGGIKTTPAMAAGVTNRIWKIEELVTLTDPRAVTLK